MSENLEKVHYESILKHFGNKLRCYDITRLETISLFLNTTLGYQLKCFKGQYWPRKFIFLILETKNHFPLYFLSHFGHFCIKNYHFFYSQTLYEALTFCHLTKTGNKIISNINIVLNDCRSDLIGNFSSFFTFFYAKMAKIRCMLQREMAFGLHKKRHPYSQSKRSLETF